MIDNDQKNNMGNIYAHVCDRAFNKDTYKAVFEDADKDDQEEEEKKSRNRNTNHDTIWWDCNKSDSEV